MIFFCISDIFLCRELYLENRLYLFLASLLFLLIPYFGNIFYSLQIQSRNVIQFNNKSKNWFKLNSNIFSFIVIISGNIYTALELTSSRIFGLNYFDNGLTKHDIKTFLNIHNSIIFYS